jgi:ElaB/YqjD/DUF883 family membrane-anchored ribosome-binding protein
VDSELEVIRTEMDATRDSLAHKISELETQVRDTVAEAGNAVSATKEGVMDVVSSVSDTVTSVKESIKETFNISKQVEDHPWGAFGVAVAVGAVGAFLLRPSKPAPKSASGFAPSSPTPPSFSPTPAASALNGEPSIVSSVFSKLQTLAVTSLMDIVQDMVQQAAPAPWKDGLKDIVKDISSQLTDEKKHVC